MGPRKKASKLECLLFPCSLVPEGINLLHSETSFGQTINSLPVNNASILAEKILL
jgi:hypothetical protein